jgi:hypothetical protein
MKKFFLMLMMCFISTSVCLADDHPIPVSSLPQQVHTFLAQHFKGKNIIYAERDRDDGKLRYEVHLSDGTEVTFDKGGDWDKIDCEYNVAVPQELIPDAVKNCVKQYPNAVVTKVDKERYGYDVELSNGLEIKINRQGQVIGYDD